MKIINDTVLKTILSDTIHKIISITGNLDNLTTEDKSSLVNSINEINKLKNNTTNNLDLNVSFTGEESSKTKIATEKTVKDCYDLLFQYVNNGKQLLETTIIDKGSSIVSTENSNNNIPTFEQLNEGIKNIVTVKESGYNYLVNMLNYKLGTTISGDLTLYEIGKIIKGITLLYFQNTFELNAEFNPGDLSFSFNSNESININRPIKLLINENTDFNYNEKFICN